MLHIFVPFETKVEFEIDSLDDGYWYSLGQEEVYPIVISDKNSVDMWNLKQNPNFKVKFGSCDHHFNLDYLYKMVTATG